MKVENQNDKNRRLNFENGKDLDMVLASITGTLEGSDIEKNLPYKDSYGTILLFKYNKGTPDVYPMMDFIKKDLANFIPEKDVSGLKNFSRTQIQCLQAFMNVVKNGSLFQNQTCEAIWNMLDKTFGFNLHERFTKQEVALFNMCWDMIERKKKEYVQRVGECA